MVISFNVHILYVLAGNLFVLLLNMTGRIPVESEEVVIRRTVGYECILPLL